METSLHCSKLPLIRSLREQLRRHGEAERFRRLEIDVQFEFDGLNDENLNWFRAFQDSIGHVGDALTEIPLVDPTALRTAFGPSVPLASSSTGISIIQSLRL